MEGVHIDRVAGGKIAERWEIKDFMGVVRHLSGTVTFPKNAESETSGVATADS